MVLMNIVSLCETNPNSYLLINLITEGGIVMKWRLRSLLPRKENENLELYIKMRMLESELNSLIDILNEKEENAA